ATALTFLALTTAAWSAGSDSYDTERGTATTPPASCASVTGSGERAPSASETARGPVLPGLIAFRRYSTGSETDGTLFSVSHDGSHERLLGKPHGGDLSG